MPGCYASILGDCNGPVEVEHFIPNSIQSILGAVTIAGFAWQKGSSNYVLPGSYAKSKLLCTKHHDYLDGLDANAKAYFQNLMLITGKYHLTSGKIGNISDISSKIDGRALEKWCLKMICGAIKARNIGLKEDIPILWIHALFDKVPWPEEWAIYIFENSHTFQNEDVRLAIDFHWTQDNMLNGIELTAFSVRTLFTFIKPDGDIRNALYRPKGLLFKVQRPDNSDVLEGLPETDEIRFHISWPG